MIEELAPLNLAEVPKSITTSRRCQDRMFLAGYGQAPSQIMLIGTSPEEDDFQELIEDVFRGTKVKIKPRPLRSAVGQMLKDTLKLCGLHDWYFTYLIKCRPDDPAHKNRPPSDWVEAFLPMLEDEIATVKPGIILCFGKAAFDAVISVPLPVGDLHGAWFWSERHNARVMYLPDVWRPLRNPEFLERFREDFMEVRREQERIAGTSVTPHPERYQIVSNAAELRDFVETCRSESRFTFAVDCEWSGRNHIDGKLRSIQFCWDPGCAVYVWFRDEQNQYAFDVSYEEAGKILGEWFNTPLVSYCGHHFAADAPWMSHVLGLEVFGKCFFDTEFAQQCVDESAPLGLERLAISYTDKGRYDIPLAIWRKLNKGNPEDGFGLIPDEILIPYAIRDVDVTLQAWHALSRELDRQGLTEYYQKTFLPFVTDIFTEFSLHGLPVDREKLDELRDLYQWAKVEMEQEFRLQVVEQADEILTNACAEMFTARSELEVRFGKPGWEQHPIRAVYEHYRDAPTFNIRSGPQMRRWLFDVLGLTPVKSTAQKEKGIPSISWEKILSYPPERQKEFTPAVDKQTLTILSDENPLIGKLLQLNAVGNIAKAFLKEADVDDEGNLIKENGLHYWIASDERIHGQMSTTETGRPRSWQPNSLNWPSYVNNLIKDGLSALLKARHEAGTLPERFARYLDPKKIPSLRSCISVEKLPPLPGSQGWCMVESDFKTAEIRGLAFKSGDENLIKIMTEPDPQFAYAIHPETGKEVVVRIGYAADCGIPPKKQDSALLLTVELADKSRVRIPEQNLLRNENGDARHPDVDLHWGLAERVYKSPREFLDKKRHRDGTGKVGNFSCLAASTEILTQKGVKTILQVDPSFDLLWDGVEWVTHEGLVTKGVMPVVTWRGLRATVDHGVWTADGREIYFGEAILQDLAIAETQDAFGRPRSAGFDQTEFPETYGDFSPTLGVAGYRGRPREVLIAELRARGFELVDEPVYDLVDAGPRHRFTASGFLVSNTAYGATPSTLERKIEADTGKKPEPGVGEEILAALDARQPIAQAWLKSLEKSPVRPGYLKAESGRIRHFKTLDDMQYPQLRERQVNSVLSGASREARNYYMQESVAFAAQRSGIWLFRHFRRTKMRARIMTILYDSVVTVCPVEERHVVAALHQRYMDTQNTMHDHGRTWSYPIDNEFNLAWSQRPSAEIQQQLDQRG